MNRTIPPADLSTVAEAYADAGWPVFPLWPISRDGLCCCSKPNCEDAGKHPATRHGHNDATNNLEIVRGWWQRNPRYGIGLATGQLTVIDFDLYKNPDALAEFPYNLPKTRVALTGGGGEHWYYRNTSGQIIRNNSERLGAGIDVRGTGGYVVAPPSPHMSGRDYEWEDAFVPIAEIPSELVAALGEQRREIPNVLTSHRNPTMAQIAGALRRVGCNEEHLYVMLAAFNKGFCFPPKSEREVDRIAKSISRYSSKADRDAAELTRARDIGDRFLKQ